MPPDLGLGLTTIHPSIHLFNPQIPEGELWVRCVPGAGIRNKTESMSASVGPTCKRVIDASSIIKSHVEEITALEKKQMQGQRHRMVREAHLMR